MGFLLVLSGCKSPPPASPHTLTIPFLKDPSTLDPRKAGDIASTTLCYMLYEGLFRSGPDGSIEKGIAKAVSLSDDRTTYLITLKQSHWSDGSALTAYDFQTSWLTQLEPSFPSTYAYLFYPIKNAQKYRQGLCSQKEVGITVLSPSLLRIELNTPHSDFEKLLSCSPFFPYKKESLSNGPFQLETHKPHQQITLKKNSFYHDSNKVSITSLHIKILDSEQTALQLFKNKELDLLGGPLALIPVEELNRTPASYNQKMAGATLCAFNTESKLFHNCHLRKAFSHAIDNAALEKLFPHTAVRPTSFIPLDMPSSQLTLFNPTLAKQELEIALTELGLTHNQLHLNYYCGSQPDHLKLAQVLLDSWKTHLGVMLQLVPLEHKLHAQKIASKEFDLIQLVWLAPYDSPSSLLDRFYDKTQVKNFCSYTSPSLTALIHKLEQNNLATTCALIDQQLQQQLPFVPLIQWTYPYYTSSKIKQLCFTHLGTLNFTFLKMNEDPCSLPLN